LLKETYYFLFSLKATYILLSGHFLATSIKSNTRIAFTVVVKVLAPEGYRESFAEFAGALSCSRHSKQRHFISYIKQPRLSASEIQNVRFGIAATLIDKTRVCSLTFQRLLAVDQTK